MLFTFFLTLRAAGLKPSLSEFLMLLEALSKHVAIFSLDDFYHLSRSALVKDETQYDRFDRAFAAYFKGVEAVTGETFGSVPEDWLKKQFDKLLSDEEKAKIQALGGLDKLMETLKQRLEEQQERHQGGNKWVGTGGTSPFGNSGFNPEGIRIGGQGGGKSAVKVWEKRDFRNLDDNIELGTRNIKVALRRLRKFAREGAPDVLDIDDTISSTARNAGYLDLKMVPERRNTVKVLLFLDVAARWTRTSRSARNCSPRRRPSSSTWNISTSTTSSTKACGRTIRDVTANASRCSTCCTSTRRSTR